MARGSRLAGPAGGRRSRAERAAAGWDLAGGRASGEVQRVESAIDLAGGLVVVECLAAGQPAGMLQDGVDLFSEWLAGRVGERPRGGPGGVVCNANAAVRCAVPIWH